MEVRKKRVIDLDAIVREYLSDIDPIERLIDWQLRTSWQLIVGEFKGGSDKALPRDTIEDNIIMAMDSKYLWARDESGVMFKLKLLGYSEKEIAEIFMCSRRWVRNRIKRFRDDTRRLFGDYERSSK